jgi:hypothetical protein
MMKVLHTQGEIPGLRMQRATRKVSTRVEDGFKKPSATAGPFGNSSPNR